MSNLRSALKLLVVSASALAVAQTASSREFADIFTDCGIGAMIAPNNDAVAAVTNVTWDLGTTAISSNISSPDTCVGGKGRTAAFIYQSYESIVSDLSKGKGEYLDALMLVSGYAKEDCAQAVEFLRQDLAVAVSNATYGKMSRFEKAEQLFNLLYGSEVPS